MQSNEMPYNPCELAHTIPLIFFARHCDSTGSWTTERLCRMYIHTIKIGVRGRYFIRLSLSKISIVGSENFFLISYQDAAFPMSRQSSDGNWISMKVHRFRPSMIGRQYRENCPLLDRSALQPRTTLNDTLYSTNMALLLFASPSNPPLLSGELARRSNEIVKNRTVFGNGLRKKRSFRRGHPLLQQHIHLASQGNKLCGFKDQIAHRRQNECHTRDLQCGHAASHVIPYSTVK